MWTFDLADTMDTRMAREVQRYANQLHQQRLRARYPLVWLAEILSWVWLVVLAVLVLVAAAWQGDVRMMGWALLSGVLAVVFNICFLRRVTNHSARLLQTRNRHARLVLDEEGIRSESEAGHVFYPWSVFQAAVLRNGWIGIEHRSGCVVWPIPLAALPEGVSAVEVLAAIDAHIASASTAEKTEEESGWQTLPLQEQQEMRGLRIEFDSRTALKILLRLQNKFLAWMMEEDSLFVLSGLVAFGPMMVLLVLVQSFVGMTAFVVALLTLVVITLICRRNLFPLRDALLASGTSRLWREPGGLRQVWSNGTRQFSPWSALASVEEAAGVIVVALKDGAGSVLIPDSAFAADAEARGQWLQTLREAVTTHQPAASAEYSEGILRRFTGDLAQYFRFILFQRLQPGRLHPSPGKGLLIFVLFAVLMMAVQMLQQPGSGKIGWMEIPRLILIMGVLALTVALTVLMGYRGTGAVLWGRLFLLLAGWLAVLYPAAIFLSGIHGARLVLAGFMPCLIFAMASVAQLWYAEKNPPGWLMRWLVYPPVVVLCTMGLLVSAAVSSAVPPWRVAGDVYEQEEYEDDADESRWKERMKQTEAFIYAQGDLLQAELQQIRPGQPGVPELYFIGMAGWATQDVFLRETRMVQALFDEVYGTGDGRSALLVNNENELLTQPAATMTSLSRVLHRVGQQMNADEDVLFLFMTSHGGADHSFSLVSPVMWFNDITPQMLRQALDDSGIRHRVVVVSACYSGGFVDELHDDNTLVISAAAADRTSFGCSDDNRFTDFAEAYFNQALRQERSIMAAWPVALTIIASKEEREERKASHPQMQGGRNVLPLLEAMKPRVEQ